MKKIIQFLLFCSIIIALISFNKIYLNNSSNNADKNPSIDSRLNENSKNNIIKNLEYEVTVNQNTRYFITSNLSELDENDTGEIIKMKKVRAIIIDKNNLPFVIELDAAEYNNFNYKTKFINNVSISYLDNKIFSDQLDIDFEKNFIMISQNVRYLGNQGTGKSDNISINLVTKQVDIYMNKKSDKVKLNKN